MRMVWTLTISMILLAEAAVAQSLGDLARQERERRAKEQKAAPAVTTDEIGKGKVDLSPPLDRARRGDLDYLLQQVSRPRVSPELLAAFVPLKEQATPKLVPLLSSTDPLKRVGPATALIVLGNSEGLGVMARVLSNEAVAAGSSGAGGSAASEESFRPQMEASRIMAYALATTLLGVWRFTEGSMLMPAQVVQRLQQGPPIELVGGVDNGQRLFNRALRDKDVNLRLGAIALIRVATGGTDFGYQADQASGQNEPAIQQITTFLTTERSKVILRLSTKAK